MVLPEWQSGKEITIYYQSEPPVQWQQMCDELTQEFFRHGIKPGVLPISDKEISAYLSYRNDKGTAETPYVSNLLVDSHNFIGEPDVFTGIKVLNPLQLTRPNFPNKQHVKLFYGMLEQKLNQLREIFCTTFNYSIKHPIGFYVNFFNGDFANHIKRHNKTDEFILTTLNKLPGLIGREIYDVLHAGELNISKLDEAAFKEILEKYTIITERVIAEVNQAVEQVQNRILILDVLSEETSAPTFPSSFPSSSLRQWPSSPPAPNDKPREASEVEPQKKEKKKKKRRDEKVTEVQPATETSEKTIFVDDFSDLPTEPPTVLPPAAKLPSPKLPVVHSTPKKSYQPLPSGYDNMLLIIQKEIHIELEELEKLDPDQIKNLFHIVKNSDQICQLITNGLINHTISINDVKVFNPETLEKIRKVIITNNLVHLTPDSIMEIYRKLDQPIPSSSGSTSESPIKIHAPGQPK